jgi:hypothetical protein
MSRQVPRIISSSSLGSAFHRGSRDQLAGGNIPHVVSASSDIFPAATASGVLADAGLTGFVPVRFLVLTRGQLLMLL